jgi:hypothetical protein
MRSTMHMCSDRRDAISSSLLLEGKAWPQNLTCTVLTLSGTHDVILNYTLFEDPNLSVRIRFLLADRDAIVYTEF